ncbi:hypothetical protein LCGC14_1878500 [marine sediment metagenome]|uniref:DUF304 domain-containing protein n=1 Tax=marine sediment metagenome TaxID=412755 RepID=A0A0F9J1H0_9ZZZZ
MPRGDGPFRLRPRINLQGQIVYRNEAIAVALVIALFGGPMTAGGVFLLWDTKFAWEGVPTVIGAVLVIGGLFVLGLAIHRLFERQRLLLDPVQRVAVFTVKTLLGRRDVRCDYEDLRLCLHEMAYLTGRAYFPTTWRGWAVVFHLPGERFVIAQISALEAAERYAAETAEQAGIAWQRSTEKIELAGHELP